MAFCSNSRINSYDAVIDQLVQLNQAAGKDKNDISILISQVSGSTKDANARFDDFSKGLDIKCKTGNTLLNEYLKKVQADRLDYETKIINAKKDNELKQTDVSKYNKQIEEANAELETLKKQIATEYQNFRTHGAEAEQKLLIIKTLRDIITDELVAPVKGSSFIQLQTFNDKVKELKTLLDKSSDSTYSPLVSTLLSLAQAKGFTDQKILSQILDVLSKLDANLRQFRDSQNNAGKDHIQNLKEQSKNKVIQITSLRVLLGNDSNVISDNLNLISSSQKDIEHIDREVLRKTEELQYWTKLCDNQREVEKRELAFREDLDAKLRTVSTTVLDLN
jgi:uncharacterized membrane-anchored protein YhcB (DUF1043 family)